MKKLIAIKEGMALDQSAKTHVHEVCHSPIHNSDSAALFDKATREVQAEGVAFVVCNRFGLDTGDYSFDYLAAWSSDRELKELKRSIDVIRSRPGSIQKRIFRAS